MTMRLRAPTFDDAPAVLAVLVARDVVDFGAPDYTLGDLHDEWSASDLDLAADVTVAEDDAGAIVGYAAIHRPGAFAVVAPDREGRGIGTRLLQWTEARERELGRQRHRQWVAASNGRGRNLLRSAGYEHARSYWRMMRRLDQVDHPRDVPAGLRIRPLDVARDAMALHELDAASFAANPDYEPESFAAFREEHLEAHDFDPGLSCLAEDRDEVVAGFLLARRRQEESVGSVGYIDILAVHPDRQRRGLGTFLLQTAFARFADAGLDAAELGVASDNPRALRLYERVGMSARFEIDTYERKLRLAPLA